MFGKYDLLNFPLNLVGMNREFENKFLECPGITKYLKLTKYQVSTASVDCN